MGGLAWVLWVITASVGGDGVLQGSSWEAWLGLGSGKADVRK